MRKLILILDSYIIFVSYFSPLDLQSFSSRSFR